ncbi:hypothetical protein BH11PSE10_BH11PSE10_13700 [soil metagenome]
MKFSCSILLGFTLISATAAAAQNLWVELRWVDSALSAAAAGGVAHGAVVIGTAGSVSPRPGLSLRSATQAEPSPSVQRVLVLSGQQASIKLTEQTTTQTVDFALDIGLPQQGGASAAGAGRVIAAPRTTTVDVSRGFIVRPYWSGGRQPVRVELQAFGARAQGEQNISSTVVLPLGDWLTVARSGATVLAPAPGSLSSADAPGQPSRELQLRVSLAP